MSDVTSSRGGSKSHFDTFETKFFEQGEQGEDDNARLAAEIERFDDLDAGKPKRSSRRFVMSVAIGSASLAAVVSIVLWHSGGHASSSVPEVFVAQPYQPTPTPTLAAEPPPAPTQDPVPAAVAANAAEPVAVAQVNPAGNRPSAADDQAVAPAPPPAAAAVVAALAPAEAKGAAEATEAKPMLANTKIAPAADAPDAQARCAKAMQGKRTKDVLAACPDALAADPAAADIAVALAKIEFDRGRVAQASMWSKKALAADANAADAYVFLGGAEQTAGHGKAAKEAYKHYLQLAPTGRYASDLRAIVGGL
jgi:tetratricopeptide (TPR) repeat protein